MTLIVGWAVALVLALFALRRRIAPPFLSPVVLVAGSMLALTLGGAFFYQDVAMAPGGAGIQLVISDQLVLQTARLLLTATTAFIVGSALVLIRRRQVPSGGPVGFRAMVLSQSTLTAGAVVCVLPLAYAMVVPGLPYLLDRPYYIATAFGGQLAGIGSQLSIAAVLGCGFLAAAWRGAARVFAVALFAVYLALFFSEATRGLALAPVLFALGVFVAAPGRRARVGLLVAVAASVVLLPLPLFLRSRTHHGLIPYAGQLPAYLAQSSPWSVLALTVLISFAVIGVTAYVQPHFPMHDLLISVNPLPGNSVGWYQIAQVHRLNIYTPYGAVGELGNAGTVAVVAYFVVLGVVMAVLDRRIQEHLRSGLQAPALLVVALVGLFCLYNQQYNLRQSTRMAYYAVALEVAVSVFLWLRARRDVSAVAAGPDGVEVPASS